MNFDQYWIQQPAIAKDADPIETARIRAARAFHFATRQERERCIEAVNSVQGGDEPAPDHAYEYMTQNREQFDAGINAAVILTKESAVDAIKNVSKS